MREMGSSWDVIFVFIIMAWVVHINKGLPMVNCKDTEYILPSR